MSARFPMVRFSIERIEKRNATRSRLLFRLKSAQIKLKPRRHVFDEVFAKSTIYCGWITYMNEKKQNLSTIISLAFIVIRVKRLLN